MPNTILDFERLAEARVFPDKTPYKSLSVHHILDISRRSGAPGREIEIAALENGIVPERYARNMRTFSLADQAALLKAHAAVVGLGGLGGAVTEILARMGIDPRGNVYYWLSGETPLEEGNPDADARALKEKRITITPISYDLTCAEELFRLRSLPPPAL